MTSLAAQSVVAGTVRQDSSRRPLAGVEVLMEKPKRQTVTDAAGHFAFESIPKGDHVLLFRSVGFRPVRYKVRVAESDSVQADALLVAFAVPLEPIKVTASKPSASMMGLEGFEERRSKGWGKFIDSTELRRADGLRLPDVLRQKAKIRLVTAGGPRGKRDAVRHERGAMLHASIPRWHGAVQADFAEQLFPGQQEHHAE